MLKISIYCWEKVKKSMYKLNYYQSFTFYMPIEYGKGSYYVKISYFILISSSYCFQAL